MVSVGFIGVGRMGSALISGFTAKGLLRPADIRAYDPDTRRLSSLNIHSEYSAFEVVEKSDVVFLCVKPRDLEGVLDEIKDVAGSRLIVSIVAGVSTCKIESKLREARVVRVMPNTPAVIYEAASAYCLGSRVLPEDDVFVGSLLNSVGVAYKVREELMDAVTALSGSGPAYVYYVAEALVAAGVREGLSEEVSMNLVQQTLRGAAGMLSATGKKPAELIDEVRSPGGTTVEALKVLDKRDVAKAFADAVKAAAKKSRQLGK